MNSSRIVFLAAVAACGVVGAILWRGESGRVTALEGQLAELKAENARLDADVAEAREKARSLEAESEQLRAARAISGTRLEPEAAGPAATPDEEGPKEQTEFLTKIFKDPEMHKLLAAQQTAALRTLYSEYLKQTTLTPEETERFFQLLQERQMALMDSSSRAMSGREVDLKAATAVTNATDAALKDLLGPGRYGQYQDFEKTLGMRVQVQQFNRQLAEEGVPLDDSQSAALIRIMSEEAAAAPPGFGLGGGMDMSAGDIDQYSQRVEAVNHRVYTRAESVLTPTQLSAFAAFQKNSETTQVAGLRMAEQMLK